MAAITNHSSFSQPENKDAKLWRYMNFTKFIDLISSKQLYLTRADKFEDTHEALYPISNKKFIEEGIKKNPVYKILNTNIEQAAIARSYLYANCWHMNEYESAAMWKLYSTTSESIAIETTYNTLVEAMPDDVYIGKVCYIDEFNEEISFNDSFIPLMHKRKSFMHENEIRIVKTTNKAINFNKIIQCDGNNIHGIKIPIDFNKTITKIHISPTSKKWFYELVKNVCLKYEVNDKILDNLTQSDLYSKTIY